MISHCYASETAREQHKLSLFLLTQFFPGCLRYVIYCQERRKFLLSFIETWNNKVHYTERCVPLIPEEMKNTQSALWDMWATTTESLGAQSEYLGNELVLFSNYHCHLVLFPLYTTRCITTISQLIRIENNSVLEHTTLEYCSITDAGTFCLVGQEDSTKCG